MKKANLADPFISPVTGSPRFIDIKSAALTTGKIWQGDENNSPVEKNLNDIVLNLPMKVWTTETRPVSPSGTTLGLNIKYR